MECKETPVEIGDFFNETDSDTDRRVIGLRLQKDPPVVLTRPFKHESDSDESTESEYVLHYAATRYESRKA